MPARFHAPAAHATGALVALPAQEAAHLTRVLRLRPGDAVRVFDGSGREFDAVVEQAGKSGVHVRVGATRDAAPERRVAVTLAQAVLKGDKMDDVIRDAAMMGVSAVQPVVSARSETTLAALVRGRRRERWERVAVASVKQCGRAVLPPVLPPCTLESLLAGLRQARPAATALMLVEPSASAEADPLRELALPPPRAATVIVGPEGGWTPAEVAATEDMCCLVTLRGPTLRADAMPVVALAAVFAKWGEL
ncbi:MAG TPA: RsmE family RNA methyltransferase [Vicinamibacterales bacterium]|nr:RsmE family RNA methyltransferase [Vicinamibacterales bacterium]